MNYHYNLNLLSKQDSIVINSVEQEKIIQINTDKQPISDTSASIVLPQNSELKDTIQLNKSKPSTKQEVNTKIKTLIVSTDSTFNSKIDSISDPSSKEYHNFFSFNLNSDSFDYKYNVVYIDNKTNISNEKKIDFVLHHYHRSQLNWTLIIGFLSIALILSIKIYYQKFLQQVINTIFNFQLADKMFHEKNLLIRRAFFLLNFNFIIIFSLLLLLLFIHFDIRITNEKYLDYLIILSVVTGLLILRYIIFYLTGVLFMQLPVVQEYLHNKYLFNKNIGLILIPILFTSIYVSPSIAKILLTSSIFLIVLITILKIFRGFQIILKNGVLLFYTILYLCTLELLPLVLGSKIIILLR